MRTPASPRVHTRLSVGATWRRLPSLMADDIEWVHPGDPSENPNGGTFRGKEAVLGWFGGLGSTTDFTKFEPREFIAQNDKVVSLVDVEATVRGTGRSFVDSEAHLWTFRDGKLARFQIFLDTAAAAPPTAWSSPARTNRTSAAANRPRVVEAPSDEGNPSLLHPQTDRVDPPTMLRATDLCARKRSVQARESSVEIIRNLDCSLRRKPGLLHDSRMLTTSLRRRPVCRECP